MLHPRQQFLALRHAVIGAFALAAAMTASSEVRADAAGLCMKAADVAAEETGVPRALLKAVMTAESGRSQGGRLQPWPWALHAEGQGYWPQTEDAALAIAKDILRRGVTNVDIGCFQINAHWHGDRFASLEAMIDPKTNARYAARFLTELRAETGDWKSAAGAYHSRDATRAGAYVARLQEVHATLAGTADEAAAPAGLPPARFALGRSTGPIIALHGARGPLIGPGG